MAGHIETHESNGAKLDTIVDDLESILLFHRRIMRQEMPCINPFNAEFRVLMILMREGVLPTTAISRIICVSKSNTTSIIDKLIDDRMVERIPDPIDRRIINVAITDKGRRFMEEGRARLREHIKEKLYSLSREEIDSLNDSFANIRVILSKIQG